MYQINTLNLHKVICQLCLNKIKNKYKKLNPKDMPTKVSKKKTKTRLLLQLNIVFVATDCVVSLETNRNKAFSD